MRVLLVCDWFLKYTAGLARGLVDADAVVALLCRDHAREFDDRVAERQALLDDLAERGVELIVLPGRVSSSAGLVALPRLRRQIAQWAPDVAHAQSNYEPRLLALSRPYPSVLTVHDPVPHPGQPELGVVQRRIETAWRRRADRIVVHGDALRDALEPSQRARAVVIPHGVRTATRPLAVPNAPVVVLLGRLEPYKGVDVLVRAMPIVWRHRPDVRLVVAGVGPACADVPDDPRIDRRFGYVPEAALGELLAEASLVVLPYTEASQTGVGSTAVAAGVPVVVTDVGALADLTVDPSFVVPAGDAEALAAAILQHIDDGVDVRQQVVDLARRTLSWEVVARRHLALYDTVCRREPVRRGAQRWSS